MSVAAGDRGQEGAADPAWAALAPARERAGLSAADLYLRYVSLGGVAPAMQLARHCAGGGVIDPVEHDLVVLALNERFLELDVTERLPYVR